MGATATYFGLTMHTPTNQWPPFPCSQIAPTPNLPQAPPNKLPKAGQLGSSGRNQMITKISVPQAPQV